MPLSRPWASAGQTASLVEQGSTAPISCVELWKVGHKRKTGEYISTDAAELASKIDELSSQESQSVETVSQGRDDILASVLGQEHPDRVRVGGKFSAITSFFKNDRRSQRTSVARIEDVEAIVQERLSHQ
ncbi:hypothetical protein KSP39_PZI023439 [Platanthera zijinensis]|uniref:Uncharacterized protein n=1 Tax=Platanthera zijinensis TaxID=2320716 RepID=A0AAP0FU52_9ASPA